MADVRALSAASRTIERLSAVTPARSISEPDSEYTLVGLPGSAVPAGCSGCCLTRVTASAVVWYLRQGSRVGTVWIAGSVMREETVLRKDGEDCAKRGSNDGEDTLLRYPPVRCSPPPPNRCWCTSEKLMCQISSDICDLAKFWASSATHGCEWMLHHHHRLLL